MARFFTGMLLGLVIAGTIFAYFAIKEPQKITQATQDVQMWQQKYQALKARVSQLIRDLGEAKKSGEEAKKSVEELRDENRRLKEELNRLKKSLVLRGEEGRKQNKGEESRRGKEAAAKLQKLLEKLKNNPQDIEVLGGIMDVIWRVKDAKLLEQAGKRLGALAKELEGEGGETAPLCYMRAVESYTHLAALQAEAGNDPSKGAMLGPKMGELAFAALKWLDKAVKLAPQELRYRVTRGWGRFYSPGMTAQALGDFRAVVDASKKHRIDDKLLKSAYIGLVLTYKRLGKKEEAEKTLQEALQIYPDSESLRRLERK